MAPKERDLRDLTELLEVIRNSFRVRKNHDPIYVDHANNLDRIKAPQHLIIFGRRGSGKSCLLVHCFNKVSRKEVTPIYILADTYKKLTYPDILIRLLIQITEELQKAQPLWRRFLFYNTPLRKSIKDLRSLLISPEKANVTEEISRGTREAINAEITHKAVGKAGAKHEVENRNGRKSSFKEHKLEILERQLQDHKTAVEFSLSRLRSGHACILLDDFYLFPRDWHADVIDYLHRLVRDTNLYLKIATIRHRTTLSRNHPQTIGVELFQDVEELNLDKTLDNVESTQSYLAQMLDAMGKESNITNTTESYFSPTALQPLTLASGGVPRDYLNIFVNSVETTMNGNNKHWLTPKCIWKGARQLTYQTKLRNLREDEDHTSPGLERVFVDLIRFCLQDKKKTAFLISQEEAQSYPDDHDVIQQLMDMKLIHIIEPDTSAAFGHQGRYEAYTLDFSLFMEPRRRNIHIVEFWNRDDDGHKKGIREAPVYPLSRVRASLNSTDFTPPEKVLELMNNEATPTSIKADQEDLFPDL